MENTTPKTRFTKVLTTGCYCVVGAFALLLVINVASGKAQPEATLKLKQLAVQEYSYCMARQAVGIARINDYANKLWNPSIQELVHAKELRDLVCNFPKGAK